MRGNAGTVAIHCTLIAWQRVSGKGEVYSFTVVQRAPSKGFTELVPYAPAGVADVSNRRPGMVCLRRP